MCGPTVEAGVLRGYRDTEFHCGKPGAAEQIDDSAALQQARNVDVAGGHPIRDAGEGGNRRSLSADFNLVTVANA